MIATSAATLGSAVVKSAGPQWGEGRTCSSNAAVHRCLAKCWSGVHYSPFYAPPQNSRAFAAGFLRSQADRIRLVQAACTVRRRRSAYKQPHLVERSDSELSSPCSSERGLSHFCCEATALGPTAFANDQGSPRLGRHEEQRCKVPSYVVIGLKAATMTSRQRLARRTAERSKASTAAKASKLRCSLP